MFSSDDPELFKSCSPLPLPAGWDEKQEKKWKIFLCFISKFVKLRREKTKQRRVEQQTEFNFTLKLVSPAGGLAAKYEWRLILN